ncbi:hypothetical protein QPL79_08380 [Ignisphaera sp. 4213-co]|uniref:DUF4145 domain-containing protein n=1 Tax=Ignisphaera cupida TaxID=3050454 RepID=A0ABD4Z7P4_9CREN|nr:hypothetical protein [Ignisphaera sp. 4213-co]MDK6029377.1 hypothetical protein [Ignisphaera sp. 4213-co]
MKPLMAYVYRPDDEQDKIVDFVSNSQLPDSIKIVLLYTYFEKIAADVIIASGERKLKRVLCKISSKKRINRALAILRKEGFLNEEEYRSIRRTARVLRCLRNSFLHRVCESSCPSINIENAIEVSKIFALKARGYVGKILSSWSVED